MRQFAQLGFPQLYERELVRPLFAPWAKHLVRAAAVRPGDRVIDVACGTGIVARLASEAAGAAEAVVGVDMNPAMLAVARELAPDIAWRAGDAAALPVADGEQFSVVLCQQGLQFFADRAAAAAEMRRVLIPSGRLGVSVWRNDEEMPVLRELRRIAEQRVGPIADRRHSFPEASDLEELLTSAGFREVRVEAVTQTVHFTDGATFVHLNAMALIGMGARGRDLSEEARAETLQQIASDSRALVEEHSGPSGFAYEIGANVATALR